MLSRILIQDTSGNYIPFKASPAGLGGAYKTVRTLPESIGTGHFTSFTLNKGVGMGICSGRFNRDYTAQIRSETPLIFLVFSIKGHAFSQSAYHRSPLVFSPGRASAYFYEAPVFDRRIKGEQELLSLVLRVSPGFMENLVNPDPHGDGARGRQTLDTILGNGFFLADHPMTPQMTTAFFQILNNPHQGRVGRIYLESKALELIALKLEQIFRTDRCPQESAELPPEERERIIHARDMLVSRLQYPPSLRELAARINMSHVRLTRGFKTVFGCTVFEYLRKERLAYARMLIEEKPVDLTWVAYESGFCSSSHFAAAFLKAYGLKPSEYRKAVFGS